jgi:nicotinate-nucleotide adenylyltransferase
MPATFERRRLGLLGGTFDPIHRGHLDVARAAHAVLALTEVWLVPSNVPPHRPSDPHASSYHRFAMVALAAVTEPGSPWLLASDVEVAEAGPSYTSRTLQRLGADSGYDRSQIFFLSGADAFAEIATWRDYPALLDRAHFAVVSRPGAPAGALRTRLPMLASRMVDVRDAVDLPAQPSILLVDADTADVSSTEVRRRFAEGHPLDGRVPAAVERYVRRHGLYRSAPASSGAADHLHEDTQP